MAITWVSPENSRGQGGRILWGSGDSWELNDSEIVLKKDKKPSEELGNCTEESESFLKPAIKSIN